MTAGLENALIVLAVAIDLGFCMRVSRLILLALLRGPIRIVRHIFVLHGIVLRQHFNIHDCLLCTGRHSNDSARNRFQAVQTIKNPPNGGLFKD